MFHSCHIFRRCLHTIYALSSGRCPSGVAVVRISGPSAREALESIGGFPGHQNAEHPRPRHAYFRRLVNPQTGLLIDRGLVLWFPRPNSFTGEDVVEFHIHGGPAVVKSLFNALSSLNEFRMAEPGEFTRRSYNNGKIDLGGAEAISDLITAETEAQHALAVGQIDKTQERIDLYASWRKSILEALASVEAWIDFSDSDDIEDGVMEKSRSNMLILIDEIKKRINDGRRGQRLRDGLHVAIIGPPNAGKSSLMNALCRDDEVSIVSPVAGTTRDAIERPCDIGGFPIVLVDTAGLRNNTKDPIELIGVERSKARALSSDVLVFVLDASEYQHETVKLTDPAWLDDLISKLLGNDISKTEVANEQQSAPVLVLFNKIDLLPASVRNSFPNGYSFLAPKTRRSGVICSISCLTRSQFDQFLVVISRLAEQMCGNRCESETTLIGGLRQLHHLKSAAELLQSFADNSSSDAVIGAESLRLAVRELGKLTGEITNEDVLNQIFSSFCIGK